MSVSCVVARIDAELRREPNRPLLSFVRAGHPDLHLHAREFRARVTTACSTLRNAGVERGDRVIVTCRSAETTCVAFIAAIWLGAVPAIRPHGARPARFEDLSAILTLTRAQFVMTDREIVGDLTTALAGTSCVAMPELIAAPDGSTDHEAEPGQLSDATDTAFIQFSSGSTGHPKAIAISHGALLRQVQHFCRALPFSSADINVSALPLFHDMGLVTQLFFPLLTGGRSVVIDPRYWALRPASLMTAIDRYAGTMTWMPNFAFAHCERSIRDRDLETVDLSSWDKLGNGSEPVDIELMRAFERRFSRFGLKARALRTGYGLAETVLSATVSKARSELKEDRVTLESSRGHVLARPDDSGPRAFASCGVPVQGTKIEIRSSTGEVLPEREVGEIWLRSDSMHSGYLDHRGRVDPMPPSNWLQTGDIGYLADDELYVCGRRDDRIIHCGHNLHPEAVEHVVLRHAGDHLAGVAAFGVDARRLGTQQVVAVVEPRRRLTQDVRARLEREVLAAVKRELTVNLSRLEFVPRGWIPRTTSGKTRRAAARDKLQTRERYESSATQVHAHRQPAG